MALDSFCSDVLGPIVAQQWVPTINYLITFLLNDGSCSIPFLSNSGAMEQQWSNKTLPQ
jgi:hypothetical protein